ncbi:hypothetical protein ACA910_017664 [Epithemia clementina (nom. ined.)]
MGLAWPKPRDNRPLQPVYNHCRNGTEFVGQKDCVHLSQHPDAAPTVLCQSLIKHPILDRLITIAERARLQSFPDSYKFSGTATQKLWLIGNAIPIMFAMAVGQSILESYQD